jgi:hypothetical protein
VHRNNWQGNAYRLCPWLLATGLAAVVGCTPMGSDGISRAPVDPEREAAHTPAAQAEAMQPIVARINQNVRAMNFLLKGGAVSAHGKLAKKSGKTESFDANGTFYFREPRNLYMQLQHALAGKIEIGSNDEEFWYWEQFEHSKYYTGRHVSVAKPWETDIPLRPDQFLDMIGLRELPTTPARDTGPVFKVGRNNYYLNFFDRDNMGKLYETKSLAISRRPPYMVSGVTYYNPDGQAWMSAEIGDYRTIEGTPVMAPTRIRIRSLRDASYMTLEIGSLRPSDNRQIEPKRITRSPLQRGEHVGEVIHLDRPAAAANPVGAGNRSGRSAEQ